jgi:hypothetical protein
MAEVTYEQDGPEAREIAQYLPYFPFKVHIMTFSAATQYDSLKNLNGKMPII